ncbi:MAG: thiamine-phosphate diphosphorylase [Lysobacterales bacterium RIFOXYD1_FULL_69_11]|nr:MAG: thiamine-phosphate diphosphorylase [Xanthomonadales bacterium RIFOXYA1_FULL_69_10]OHE86706.1 MAG: thiamine-phosphate diphosphorylase [Xanthomonadales bacterium RIFOXYD1_FULL_69_11]
MNERWPRTGLYAITPDETDTAHLLERTRAVLAAGAAWLQYRNKKADAALRREQAASLLEACRAYDVPLIVNDDWRLAADIGAAGAHLGEDDGDLRAARMALGDGALVGASCYDDIELARRAVDLGATYVAFGAFFPSPTKPNARRADPALLGASTSIGVPRVAIGGITPDNAPSLVAAGADLVAVISGVFDAADPAMAVRRYVRALAPSSDAARHDAGANPGQTR